MIGTVDEMPTECERSDVTLCGQQQQQQREEEPVQQRLTQQTQQINQQQQLGQYKINTVEKSIESESYTMEDVKELATNGEMSTSQTSTTSTTSSTNENGCSNGGSKKSSIISPDPTAYVTKARVTRPTPPPPSYNPMQFVQIKPSHLYQTAQQQLKKAEEVKKIKEIKKEEPEDWQNNLDNWKSSRRKRVEHIIDRVVEVKKLELEEHDRSRRKSKTFSEMIEERSERGTRGRTKLASLAVYNEDESNDLSDLGIGTSSASGKSSLSEDYDNNSVMSDNVTELDKTILLNKNAQQQIQQQNNCKINSNNLISNNNNRSYVSSPGYDTSSSTAPASSPDPCEYTYEGAIQDYKQRVSRASSSGIGNGYKLKTSASKESTPERQTTTTTTTPIYPTRRGSKIEDRLIGFEVSSPSDSQECVEKQKVVVPKIDISKRKEVFEQTTQHTKEPKSSASTTNGIPKVTLRERFNAPTAKITETNSKQDLKRMSGDMTSIRDRMQNLEQQKNSGAVSANGSNNNKLVDITVPPLKDRLSCLHSAASKEDVKKKPVQLVDDRQLEIMKSEEENAQLRLKAQQMSNNLIADIETELDNTLQQLTTAAVATAKEEEVQLNAAIAALEVEEQKLEAASNAVHKMEAEFAELSDQALLNTTKTTTTTTTTNDMEFSVSDTNENLAKHSIEIDTSGVNSSSKNELVSEQANIKLQRKPTNEMIHHRNLLKMFRDTFNTDMSSEQEQLELAVEEEQPIVTALSYTPYTNVNINAEENNLHRTTHSMIPRSVVHTPVGKPPMSPKIARSQKCTPSPSPSSPPITKAENQFSINGRVEIFNSKSFINNTETSGSNKSTPILSRKSFLPHFISNNNNNNNMSSGIGIGSSSNTTDASNTMATVTVKPNEPLPMVSNQSSLEIEAVVDVDRKLMSKTTVSEPQVIRSKTSTTNKGIIVKQEALKDHQQQKKNDVENEVIICAPPVTILYPDELPKPNTVKSLASCFSNANDDVVDGCKMTPPSPVLLPPRPMPRNSFSKLPRQIPTTELLTETAKLPKRNLANDTEASEIQSYGTVILHKTVDRKPLVPTRTQAGNLLKPNDSLATVISEPAVEPQLVACTPNSSSLFKMAGSTPSSPLSQRSNASLGSTPNSPPSQTDITLCEDLLDALAATSHFEKVSAPPKLAHQNTVEEVVCTKVDIKKIPPGHIEPCTGFAEVSVEDIVRCDNVESTTLANKTKSKSVEDEILLSQSKTNAQSLDAARTAHTKHLIETCERIIAEERLESSRLKSVVNSQKSTNQTPLMQRKSKIPLPKGMSCLKGSESINSADLEQNSQEEGPLIARLHVVETEIKVTTTSPPPTPSAVRKTQKSQIPSPTPTKKTKNIFDFLKKNFGHQEETNTQESNKSLEEMKSKNEIHTVDNSTFYLNTETEEEEEEIPPPLPTTPAPVNIEIKKTITTNEILEAANTELGLSQEINELLDDELNRLTLEKGACVSGAK